MAFPIVFKSSDNLPWYRWTIDAGNVSQIPSFDRTESDLQGLIDWSERPMIKVWPLPNYTLHFSSLDCTTAANTRNCTEACRDGPTLFTPTNLRICSMLAAAALLVKKGVFSIDPSDDATRRVAEEWQVPSLTAFDGAGVLGNITTCISRSCIVATEVGTCTDRVKLLNTIPINASSLATVVGVLGNYCDRLDSFVNTDIAGPGVVLSYIFQTSLALLFFTLVKLFTLWPREIFNFFGHWRASLRERGHRLQALLASSHPSAAVMSSLVEFQEVQLYFLGSIQIAALVSFDPNSPDTGSANSNSFGSALLNSAMAHILCVNGVYSILLCQVCLHRKGMRWWYTFSLLTVVFGLALAIVVKGDSLMPPVHALWKKLKEDEPVPACGENPSPLTYCDLSMIADPSGAGYIFALIGSLAYAGIAIDQFAYSMRAWRPTWDDFLARRPYDSKAARIANKAGPWLCRVYWFGIQVILLFCTGWYYSSLVYASSRASIWDPRAWTFGQLIAVMVWAPTIAKYIYYNIFSVEGGFEERVPKDYIISLCERPSHKSDGLPEHQQDLKQAATYPLVRADGRRPVREGPPLEITRAETERLTSTE